MVASQLLTTKLDSSSGSSYPHSSKSRKAVSRYKSDVRSVGGSKSGTRSRSGFKSNEIGTKSNSKLGNGIDSRSHSRSGSSNVSTRSSKSTSVIKSISDDGEESGSSSVKVWNGTDGKAEQESAHYKVLMSWELDLALGRNAKHGPILYAIEKFPEKLKCKGTALLYVAM